MNPETNDPPQNACWFWLIHRKLCEAYLPAQKLKKSTMHKQNWFVLLPATLRILASVLPWRRCWLPHSKSQRRCYLDAKYPSKLMLAATFYLHCMSWWPQCMRRHLCWVFGQKGSATSKKRLPSGPPFHMHSWQNSWSPNLASVSPFQGDPSTRGPCASWSPFHMHWSQYCMKSGHG